MYIRGTSHVVEVGGRDGGVAVIVIRATAAVTSNATVPQREREESVRRAYTHTQRERERVCVRKMKIIYQKSRKERMSVCERETHLSGS